jgi:hypothetical protein
VKFQNVDLPFLSFEDGKNRQNKLLKIIVIGFLSLIILLILYFIIYNSNQNSISTPVPPTPTAAVSPTPTLAKEKTEIEKIRENWIKARTLLNENNFDSKLLQPPNLELELELDE